MLAQAATGSAKQFDKGNKANNFEAVLGVGAILLMVTITGYSAIYFERMLKKEGERITIWERNFQLAFYSILLLLGVVISENYNNMDSRLDKLRCVQYFFYNINLFLFIRKI